MVNLGGLLAGGATVAIVIKAVDGYSKEFKKAEKSVKGVDKSIAGFSKNLINTRTAMLALGGASAIAIGALGVMAFEARRFIPIQESFNKLLGQDAPIALEKSRDALKGTVDDMTLMTKANLFFQNIATATPDQFAKIAEAAGPLARAVGISIPEAFDRLVLGISKGETELLDELGLALDATVANKKYAESVGKTTGELTKQERATAALNQVLETLDVRMARLPELQEDAATQGERLAASFSNFADQIGALTLEVITGMEEINSAAGFTTDILNKWADKIKELRKEKDTGPTIIGGVEFNQSNLPSVPGLEQFIKTSGPKLSAEDKERLKISNEANKETETAIELGSELDFIVAGLTASEERLTEAKLARLEVERDIAINDAPEKEKELLQLGYEKVDVEKTINGLLSEQSVLERELKKKNITLDEQKSLENELIGVKSSLIEKLTQQAILEGKIAGELEDQVEARRKLGETIVEGFRDKFSFAAKVREAEAAALERFAPRGSGRGASEGITVKINTLNSTDPAEAGEIITQVLDGMVNTNFTSI